MLAGEIYEGLQQVKKIFNNRVSQSIGDLPEEIEEIKDDLNDTNKDIKIIQYIRDNISHHRSLKDLPSALDQIDLNQHQTFYRSDPSSNYKNKFFYNFAAKAQEETIVLGVRQVIHSEAMKLTEAANRAKPVTLEQEMKIEDLRTEAEKLTAEARSIDLKKISEKVQEIFRLLSRYMDFIIFTLCAKLNLDRQDVLLSNVPSSSELTSNYFFYSRED
ncbi:hypothetical protein DB346_24610 [Verrucomicrobia bacterium LW23]|nr:hypothetical protein DB346_24610 [Verrucomicrobia bacterium LW23]